MILEGYLPLFEPGYDMVIIRNIFKIFYYLPHKNSVKIWKQIKMGVILHLLPICVKEYNTQKKMLFFKFSEFWS